jgi:hypothetical protein
MTMRKDHTNKVYGVVTVVEPDPQNLRMWIIRWGCCGREQSVSAQRAASIARDPPCQCRACHNANRGLVAAPEPEPKPRPHRTLTTRTKHTEEMLEEIRNREGVVIPGYGFWPIIHGPMGPRFGRGYYSDHTD